MMTCHHATRIWLRPQASHQAPRPHWRPSMRCSALRSHLLPPPGQSAGGKKKVNVYKGSFFIWVCATGTHATSPPQCHPRRGRWASAMLCCGAVLGLEGQSAALPSLSTADAIRTRRPWLGSQPWARRASKPLANLITTAPPRTDCCVMRINSASIVNQSAHTYS